MVHHWHKYIQMWSRVKGFISMALGWKLLGPNSVHLIFSEISGSLPLTMLSKHRGVFLGGGPPKNDVFGNERIPPDTSDVQKKTPAFALLEVCPFRVRLKFEVTYLFSSLRTPCHPHQSLVQDPCVCLSLFSPVHQHHWRPDGKKNTPTHFSHKWSIN